MKAKAHKATKTKARSRRRTATIVWPEPTLPPINLYTAPRVSR